MGRIGDRKILLVDDDADVVECALGMIDHRHQAVGTTSTAEALELIAGGGFWLLITDIRMPGENGFQLITKAKQVQPELSVMILSTFYDASDHLVGDAVSRYADLALAKPLVARTLNDAIDSLA